MRSESISLCMVVRNEAFFLRDAIESARPVVDEMVVVDTGSTDATPDIARRLGARVIESAWPGDLGKAHALPVSHARGDWILSLDGDEVLDPGARHLVRDLAASGACDGYCLPVRNYTHTWPNKWRPADPLDRLTFGAGGYIPTAPVRLFRRREQYTYTGLLHQTVRLAIIESGGCVGAAEVPIHHYGFIRSDRTKSALYAGLARRQAADAPDDPSAWIELGIVLGECESPAAAASAFRRARALGESPTASFMLGTTLLDMDCPEEAIRLLREAIRGNPRDELTYFDRADAWESIGTAYEDMGRWRDAEHAYRAALRTRPESPAAMVNLAALLAERDRTDEADRLLDRLLLRYRGHAIVWNTLGVVRLRQGDLKGARTALETALDVSPRNVAARANLGLTYARMGHPRKAARAFAAAQLHGGSEQADHLRLADRLPPARGARAALRSGAALPGGVVHLIEELAGGAGRVLVDGVRALRGRSHIVLCRDACTYSGQELGADLEREGVPVVTTVSVPALRETLAHVRPAVVIHHWAANSIFLAEHRTAGERWICIGHDLRPMPPGYDAYVVISDFSAQFQQHLPGDQIHRFPNGIDRRAYSVRGRKLESTVTIAMLSRLERGKFPRRLLDYLEPLADLDARVLIAGYGPRRHEIEPEVRARGLARWVRFVGPIKAGRVPDFLSSADIGLHLTETHQELCSMAILEMMAAGLPIVAEPKGGLPEMIVTGENGYLESDERDIVARLRQLVVSPGLRRRMGAKSRRMAARFDMARFERSLRTLVRDVASGNGSAVSIGSGRRMRSC